jgi:hypothetical protein
VKIRAVGRRDGWVIAGSILWDALAWVGLVQVFRLIFSLFL